jgi:hypothetical protein
MHVWITEHILTGLTNAHLVSVRSALDEIARRMSVTGQPIRLLECSYLPPQRLVCTFAAVDENQVREACDLAQLPRPTYCKHSTHDNVFSPGSE